MLAISSLCSFNERGLYLDGGAIFASSILLLVLLAFSTNRIFGLDRFVANASRWEFGLGLGCIAADFVVGSKATCCSWFMQYAYYKGVEGNFNSAQPWYDMQYAIVR